MSSKFFESLSSSAGGEDTGVGEDEFLARSLASTVWSVELRTQSPASLQVQSRRGEVVAPPQWHSVAMKEDREERPWADLNAEVLAEIFDLLSFEERLTVLPLVCKDWREASLYPASWRNVDLKPWITREVGPVRFRASARELNMDRLVRFVVDRSCGNLRQLHTRFCTGEALDYLAEKCPQLTVLSLCDCGMVQDESAVRLAERCKKIEELDLSDCYEVSSKSIAAFGSKCPQLRHFTRRMVNWNMYKESPPRPRGDMDAFAIAKSMASLKHLDLTSMFSLTDAGLIRIANSCKDLETLDISGCFKVSLAARDLVRSLCPKLTHYIRPMMRKPWCKDLCELIRTFPAENS
ncbi:hypothetical protein MARPO_0106s0002 [Marchantia polymorpha]|uniref:F-box domain-containing protein n=1 Tax=Marchantia polymorpha TaxID=3197 RepID=A0A2R6WD63_MARPO|nr:hypothetical protein MARPO_0106s0002 [Marchantia polymorpha]|eukprot:PTQ31796.1 hypothetical protein MARPO_0106s0002 [Marchantia polymorpha]